jgi:hypothetical protein
MSRRLLNFISPSISIESLPQLVLKLETTKLLLRISHPDQLKIMTNLIVYNLVQQKKQLILVNYFQWDEIHIKQENRGIS